MKTLSMKQLVFAIHCIATLGLPYALASESSTNEFASHLREELQQVDLALTASEFPTPLPQEVESNETFYFRRFWFRDRARAGFHVPGLAKLEIIPEVEMLWERDLPQGWAQYRPTRN